MLMGICRMVFETISIDTFTYCRFCTKKERKYTRLCARDSHAMRGNLKSIEATKKNYAHKVNRIANQSTLKAKLDIVSVCVELRKKCKRTENFIAMGGFNAVVYL